MNEIQDIIRDRVIAVRERIEAACGRSGRDRGSVRLIAVTKTAPVDIVQQLIDLGIRDIGENRVQEITAKAPFLRGEYNLHMIGRLQTNKVGPVLPFVKWIQSIDRERLVERIERCHTGAGKIDALVEVNTTGEEAKTGCAPSACAALCERVARSSSLQLRGLMTIGPLGGSESRAREAFSLLRKLAEGCRELVERPELSMGMSDDFEWAIEEGATMVRVGTALAGRRDK